MTDDAAHDASLDEVPAFMRKVVLDSRRIILRGKEPTEAIFIPSDERLLFVSLAGLQGDARVRRVRQAIDKQGATHFAHVSAAWMSHEAALAFAAGQQARASQASDRASIVILTHLQRGKPPEAWFYRYTLGHNGRPGRPGPLQKFPSDVTAEDYLQAVWLPESPTTIDAPPGNHCDFCSAELTKETGWVFNVKPYKHKQPIGGHDVTWHDDGAWLACQPCRDLVSQQDLWSLYARVKASAATRGLETPPFEYLLNAWSPFFLNLDGPSKPWDGVIRRGRQET